MSLLIWFSGAFMLEIFFDVLLNKTWRGSCKWWAWTLEKGFWVVNFMECKSSGSNKIGQSARLSFLWGTIKQNERLHGDLVNEIGAGQQSED